MCVRFEVRARSEPPISGGLSCSDRSRVKVIAVEVRVVVVDEWDAFFSFGKVIRCEGQGTEESFVRRRQVDSIVRHA